MLRFCWVWFPSQLGCVFPVVFSGEIVVVVFPMSVGCCWVVLATLGPRTTLGSPCLAWAVYHHFGCSNVSFSSPEMWINWFFYVCEVVGLWTVLEWEWRLGVLDKPSVFGSLIDRARGLPLFNTPPWIALEGKSGPKGLCIREGIDSLCWVCVGVLEVKLDLVWVSLNLPWVHHLSS